MGGLGVYKVGNKAGRSLRYEIMRVVNEMN